MEDLSPSSRFYGPQATKRLYQFLLTKKNIQETEKCFKERPLPTKQKSSVFKPPPGWRKFPTQSAAVEYASKWRQFGCRVFAAEKGDAGKREYICASYDHFWKEYIKLSPSKRNHYEVILPDDSCHLYFDLEYPYATNADANEIELLDTFIQYTCKQIKACFNIDCTRSDVLDLASSSQTKFSRHLIFHLKDAVFASNLSCGRFVHHICHSLQTEVKLKSFPVVQNGSGSATTNDNAAISHCSKDEKLEHDIPIDKLRTLLLRSKSGSPCMLCDLGVYTRYRNFRLYLSSKWNKSLPLCLSAEDRYTSRKKYKSLTESTSFSQEVFLDSLVCNTAQQEQRILNFECSCTPQSLRERTFDRHSDIHETHTEQGYHATSPFPELDQFVAMQASKRDVRGRIRRWIHFPESSSLIYDIDGNRWCDNIGRQHKSNHIYYVVDLKRGVCYQKCHDPECQALDFKSAETQLPVEVNPLMNSSDLLIEEFDSSMEELLQAADEAEMDYVLSKMAVPLIDSSEMEGVVDSQFRSSVPSENATPEYFQGPITEFAVMESEHREPYTAREIIDCEEGRLADDFSQLDFDCLDEELDIACF